MKSFLRFLGKLIGIGAVIYGILFAVFYWDLDGKFMYYIWEPMMVKRFDNMKRADNTSIPYLQKDKVAPDEYTQIL
ncbi:hypothetical protein bpr_I1772 [Butyrivibrio proteoclasticus B316]|uniref:Uncharacterized protein n=1 Tax=Butyrivibrio proteoclasticus (strain ATCC 51982 / DSM 14932 / B316) TaxID=515622 RepID=E0RV89_BUTPB|nr:hypothetical protein [Butyrivibrio proteoclasticus]ADL34508.1 hypothetical protein bpr_I1772 [Butyrivibrio proteoclasticus B316]